MMRRFEDIPRRIFLDSSTLQTLQDYGEFIYENALLTDGDPIYRDSHGVAKIETLRLIMQIAQRAPFQFALSRGSLAEIEDRENHQYMGWAYDVLHHWNSCLEESGPPRLNKSALKAIDSHSFDYLSRKDRILLKDAVALGCDSFLTMENKLPKNARHIEKVIGLRLLTPVDMWEYLAPWAALFI